MTSLNVLASKLRDTSNRCWQASYGTNPPVMRKALTDTVTDIETVVAHMGYAREIGPDTDLELTLLASRMLQLFSQGDVRGAKDDWLRAWAYMEQNEQEVAS